MSGGPRDPSAGAAEAARLAREVQDLGFDAARAIVGRFVEIFAQFAATSGGAGGPRRNGGTEPARARGYDPSSHISQYDWRQATDAYVDLLSRLSEAGLWFLDATRDLDPTWFMDPTRYLDPTRWWEPSSDGEDLRLPDVAPGGRSSARLWLQNTTTSAAVALRPWCPSLVSHTGASLPAGAVTCTPARVDRLEPGESREVLVTVAIGDDASPGTYHGQLLVDGLPDVVFPVRAKVLPDTDRR